MRNMFADTFFELGVADPRLCIVVADISPAGSISRFRQEFPHRFINTGVAEQAMIGIAAGMAIRGMRVFAYTIAPFVLYRPFEMVRDDLCYQNLPVTIVGIGGGVTYSTQGGTHQPQEDIAIACAVPNLRVIAPIDPLEVHNATRWCATQATGPTYLRLARAGEPILTSDAVEPWRFGLIRCIAPGTDVAILTYGAIGRMAFQVREFLSATGVSVGIYSVSTLKPLDNAGIAQVLRDHGLVVTLEECVSLGGLGMQVKSIAWDERSGAELLTFALRDEFIHCHGTHDEVLARHGVTPDAIALGISAALKS